MSSNRRNNIIWYEKELPTLSKSTIYKTLNAFVKAKTLIEIEITIENNEVRYEYNLMDHEHFKCEKYGIVYDFKVDLDFLQSDELGGFKINDKNICFKGICKCCLINSH